MKKIILSTLVAGAFAALNVVVQNPAVADEQIAYNITGSGLAFTNASLDLDQLETRLRDTPAIGTWTKLRLKGTLDDIMDGVGRHYEGTGEHGIEKLKARFFSLAAETAAKLKAADPVLSNTIASSRDAIWETLSRP